MQRTPLKRTTAATARPASSVSYGFVLNAILRPP
jgi:hypothetical protein